jgi:hypothetical protein
MNIKNKCFVGKNTIYVCNEKRRKGKESIVLLFRVEY